MHLLVVFSKSFPGSRLLSMSSCDHPLLGWGMESNLIIQEQFSNYTDRRKNTFLFVLLFSPWVCSSAQKTGSVVLWENQVSLAPPPATPMPSSYFINLWCLPCTFSKPSNPGNIFYSPWMGSQWKNEWQFTSPMPGNKKIPRQHGGLGGSPPAHLLYLSALACHVILPPCPQCSSFPTFWCSLCCWKNPANSSHWCNISCPGWDV